MCLFVEVRILQKEIMVDESTGVAGLTSKAAKPDLPRCEGTDPSGELDKGTPGGQRKMNEGEARPSKGKETAAHHEHDEREMADHEKIRQEPVDHGSTSRWEDLTDPWKKASRALLSRFDLSHDTDWE